MRRNSLVLLLTLLLPASDALAGDLDTSIRKAVARETAAQSTTVMRSSKRAFVPGIAAFGVGGPLVIYGALKTMEGACNGPADAQVACGRGHYPAVVGAGVGLVLFGGFLMWKGGQQTSAPELVPQVGGVAIRSRVRW